MGDIMTFPATFDEFAEEYKIVDKKEVYTNGTALIPIFRVKQWIEDNPKAKKENEYKKLYEQLLEDFEHALHYAGKNNGVCNFCEYDCGEAGTCKGRENRFDCNPKWRGIGQTKADGE